MSAHIGTNFTLESKEFLDSRQGLALTKKDLLDWRTPVPEGFRVCLDRKWYYYDSSANLEDTGHWVPCVVDSVDGEVYEGQTVSAKAVKELGSASNSTVGSLRGEFEMLRTLVDPLIIKPSTSNPTSASSGRQFVNEKLDYELIGKKVGPLDVNKKFDLNDDGIIDEKDKTLWNEFFDRWDKIDSDSRYYSTSNPSSLTYEVGHLVRPEFSLRISRKLSNSKEDFDNRSVEVQTSMPCKFIYLGDSFQSTNLITSNTPSDFDIYCRSRVGLNPLNCNITYKFRYRKFVGASELLDFSSGTIKSSQLEGKLVSSFVESGTLDKTVFNCSGGKYPYIIIPAQYYNPTNKMYVGGFLNTDLVVEDVNIENKVGVVVPYKVIRTRLKQTGSSIPVQITAQ